MEAIKIVAHSWKLLTTWTNFQSSFLQDHNLMERFNKHSTAKTALVPLMHCLHHCSPENLVSQKSQKWEGADLQ